MYVEWPGLVNGEEQDAPLGLPQPSPDDLRGAEAGSQQATGDPA